MDQEKKEYLITFRGRVEKRIPEELYELIKKALRVGKDVSLQIFTLTNGKEFFVRMGDITYIRPYNYPKPY